MQSGQSTPKEVKYAQYLVYAASIIYLVVSLLQEINEAIAQMKADRGFSILVVPFFVCAFGFFIGRSLGRLHSETRKFIILLASLNLLFSVVAAVQQWLSRSLPVAGNTLPPVYGYVSEILYVVISVFLLYYLTRPHVREAFRKPDAAFSQSKASGAREDGTQDEA